MPEFETQRQPVPRNDGGELDTALAFLTFARECVLKKTDGLDDEQLRRRIVPSGTSLLWLVRHLPGCEVAWFDYHLVGALTHRAGMAGAPDLLDDGQRAGAPRRRDQPAPRSVPVPGVTPALAGQLRVGPTSLPVDLRRGMSCPRYRRERARQPGLG